MHSDEFGSCSGILGVMKSEVVFLTEIVLHLKSKLILKDDP